MKNTKPFVGLVLTLMADLILGAPVNIKRQTVRPSVSGTPQVVGLIDDPAVNRDSCASARFNERMLWTCRDTQPLSSQGIPLPTVVSSTASWTNHTGNGLPLLISDDVVYAYGTNNEQPFYPLLDDECNTNSAGACGDGSRYAIWPDSPPLVTSTDDSSSGDVTAYTWIKQAHIENNLASLTPYPATTLYRLNYSPASAASPDALPSVSVVAENFWPANGIPYGDYGNLVARDGYAYLYGQTAGHGVALARVPVADIEDSSAYAFYVDGAWTSSAPGLNDAGVAIPNASAGGQGTYYYSDAWQSYVWIGQADMSVAAQFYITTAPSPEGPWAEPFMFHEAENGTGPLGAYSLAANPGMVSAGANEIYLTYTKHDLVSLGVTRFSTPLIHVSWE